MKILFKKVFILLVISALVFTVCTGCASKSSEKKETPVVWDASIKKGVLDNGMTYLVRKNSIPANRISLRLVVNAGSAMEDDDQKGIAHFVEHMAFNGTEHFEKSEIINYFEKIGVAFGANLNGYTSFEKTVYLFEIPADDPKMLETALLILHDWACAISFDPEEIEKERGVIVEDWRIRENLQGRISEKQAKYMLEGSRFEDRLPIGDMDIVRNVSRERIVDFYKKWYRPEFMSVIVVGDEETAELEKAVKNAMGSIPASDKKVKLPKYSVPGSDEKSISIMRDKEQPYTFVYLINPVDDVQPRATEEDLKDILEKEIAATIFNARMSEITNSSDALWLYATSSEINFTNWTDDELIYVCPKPGLFTEAFKAILDETDKFLNFGVTETELERQKEYHLSQAELMYQNKDKIENSTFAENLEQYASIGKIPVAQENYKKMYARILPQITVESVNEEAMKMFGDRGSKLLIITSENETLPSEDEIKTLWTEHKNEEIKAYTDDVAANGLMTRPAKKAKIISKAKNKNLGTTEYVLENGIRIITKQNDYNANLVYMNASSKGGRFQLEEEDVPSAMVCINYKLLSGFDDLTYAQLMKELQTKQLGLNIGIDNVEEYLSGNFKADDMTSMLQFIYLFFAQQNCKEEIWQMLSDSYRVEAESFGSKPEQLYSEKINEVLYGKNDLYYGPFNLERFNKMNPASAEKVYKERFANPADFTFIFTGDFKEKELMDECCYYLGNLKTTEAREETVYKYWDFPKGITSSVVKNGIGDQGKVHMEFGGELPANDDIETTYKEVFIINELSSLLDMRLREIIREDKSGTYGIGTDGYIDGYPERFYRVSVDFGCEPSREQELVDEIINQMRMLQNEPIDQVYIDKLREVCKRNRETNLYENYWWLSRIKREMVLNCEPEWVTKDIDKLLSWITADNLQAAAKKYLDTDNYVSVFLAP